MFAASFDRRQRPCFALQGGGFLWDEMVAVIPLHAGCFILAARARGAFPARMRRRFFACLAQRGGTNEKRPTALCAFRRPDGKPFACMESKTEESRPAICLFFRIAHRVAAHPSAPANNPPTCDRSSPTESAPLPAPAADRFHTVNMYSAAHGGVPLRAAASGRDPRVNPAAALGAPPFSFIIAITK